MLITLCSELQLSGLRSALFVLAIRLVKNDEHIVETFRGAVVIKHVATFRRPAAHMFIQHLGVWRFRPWYPHPRPLFQ